jgi:hypothetical protein
MSASHNQLSDYSCSKKKLSDYYLQAQVLPGQVRMKVQSSLSRQRISAPLSTRTRIGRLNENLQALHREA